MHHKRLPNAFFGASLRHDSPALAILVLLLFLFFDIFAPDCHRATGPGPNLQRHSQLHWRDGRGGTVRGPNDGAGVRVVREITP